LVRDYEVRCDASGGAICFGALAPSCASAPLYFSDVGCHVGARLPSIRAYRSVSQLQQCPLGFWLDGVGENYKKLVELLVKDLSDRSSPQFFDYEGNGISVAYHYYDRIIMLGFYGLDHLVHVGFNLFRSVSYWELLDHKGIAARLLQWLKGLARAHELTSTGETDSAVLQHPGQEFRPFLPRLGQNIVV